MLKKNKQKNPKKGWKKMLNRLNELLGRSDTPIKFDNTSRQVLNYFWTFLDGELESPCNVIKEINFMFVKNLICSGLRTKPKV